MEFQQVDGGRAEAGFRGSTGDCVVRAIAIAAGIPYRTVYNDLNKLCKASAGLTGKRHSARTGIPRKVFHAYILSLGFRWVSCMGVGTGCKVHLRPDELPEGRLIVRVSKHLVAVIDGVIHDTHDCSRDGTRCVYGYYSRSARVNVL